MAQKKTAGIFPKHLIRRFFLLSVYYFLTTGILVVAGILTLNRVVMPTLVKKGIELEVPELIGLEYSEAAQMVRDFDFRTRAGAREPHPKFASGVVIGQDPGSGEQAKPSRVITLTVSSGPAKVTVPSLIGMGCREALAILALSELEVGDIVMVEVDWEPVGQVLATAPSPGERLVLGEEVDILLSGSPEPTCYIVPDLLGLGIGDVFSELRRKGIGISRRMFVRGTGGKEGTVLSVMPPPGFKICRGESVSVAVRSS